jgi:hypothetical protein
MKKAIKEILKFSNEVLEKGNSLPLGIMSTITSNYGINLPLEYYELVRSMNGFSIMGDGVVGIKHESLSGISLEQLYQQEHYEVENPMSKFLVPFCNDGEGNHYCIDCANVHEKTETAKIIFWQWDYSYSEVDQPEVVNDSLAEWILEIPIGWTLENHDYEGNEK